MHLCSQLLVACEHKICNNELLQPVSSINRFVTFHTDMQVVRSTAGGMFFAMCQLYHECMPACTKLLTLEVILLAEDDTPPQNTKKI